MTGAERRKAQRVDANLAVTVKSGPGEAQGRALNVSASGLYFESPYFIAPLTKVHLDLVIPEGDAKGKESTVGCDGVVVRVEPERRDPAISKYNVAIFFTLVPESSQKTLDRYIRSRLIS